MIKVRARITLFKGVNKRQSPFSNGYRPLFRFVDSTLTSGQIKLINQDHFCPGEEGVVEVTFLNREFLGDDFGVGKSFNFSESNIPLGEGEIIEEL